MSEIQPINRALVCAQAFARLVGAGSTDAVHVARHLNLRMLVGLQALDDFRVVFYKTRRITVALEAKRAQKMMRTKFDYFFHLTSCLNSRTHAAVNIALSVPEIIKGNKPNWNAFFKPTNSAN